MRVSLFESFRFRLIASVVLIEVIMLSIMVWNNVETVYRTHTDRLYESSLSLVNQFAAAAGAFMVEVDYASLEEYADAILQHREVAYVEVYDLDNLRVVSLGEIKHSATPVVDAHPTRVEDGVFDIKADILLAGRLQGHVYVGFSLKLMQQTIQAAMNRSIGIAVAEIILSVIATIALGLYLTRNLRALSEAAASVGEGHFDVVVPVQRQDEVGLTSMAFNKMVDAIAERTHRIQEKQDQVQLLLDSTEEAIYGIDMDGRCTFVNAACLKLLGYRRDSDLVDKPMHELTHHRRADGSSFSRLECKICSALQSSSSVHTDDEFKWRADGSVIPVEYWSHPIRREGKIEGAVVTFIDITERKRIEQELNDHRDNLEKLVEERTEALEQQATIIDQIHDSVISTDMKGFIVSWNGGAERLFGYTEAEARGRHIGLVYPDDEHDRLAKEVIQPLREKGEHETEVCMLRKSGERFIAHLSLTLQYDKNDKPVGMIGYSIDITQSRLAEDALKQKALELEAINSELAAFSYSVSHDLRAPLRAINGFSNVLAEDYANAIDDTGKDYLRRICRGAERMGLLIDDLLMLSRVSRDEMRREAVDLTQMAQTTVEKLRQEEPDRQVKVDIRQGLSTTGDKRLLQIGLDNLLGNAWKYTRRTENAEITLGMLQSDGKPVYYVRDNGAGFDMTYQDKLFGAFQRLHSTSEFEGTGIGLATVQRIIHRHGGKIWAEAKVDQGATFYFTLNALSQSVSV